MSEYVYVVTGNSESGDTHGPYVYRNKPTDETLRKLVKELDGLSPGDWGYGEGPGNFDSYIFLKVDLVEIEENTLYGRCIV